MLVSMESGVFQRFRDFLAWTAWSRVEAGFRLGCDPSHVSLLAHGKRLPGRRVANAIARESALWPDGPIASTEWDAAESAAVVEAIDAP
jgi:hypothetical protein